MSKNTWELFIPAPVCEEESIEFYNAQEIQNIILFESECLCVSNPHINSGMGGASGFRYEFDYEACAVACLQPFVYKVLSKLEAALKISFDLTSLLRVSNSSKETQKCCLQYSKSIFHFSDTNTYAYAQIQVSTDELETICQYGETNYLKELHSFWKEISTDSSGYENIPMYESNCAIFFNRDTRGYDLVYASAAKIILLILEERLGSNWERDICIDIYKQLELSDFLIKVEDYDLF